MDAKWDDAEWAAAYQAARRGKYGWIVDGKEVLYETKPEGPSYKYDDNYELIIKPSKK